MATCDNAFKYLRGGWDASANWFSSPCPPVGLRAINGEFQPVISTRFQDAVTLFVLRGDYWVICRFVYPSHQQVNVTHLRFWVSLLSPSLNLPMIGYNVGIGLGILFSFTFSYFSDFFFLYLLSFFLFVDDLEKGALPLPLLKLLLRVVRDGGDVDFCKQVKSFPFGMRSNQ